MNAHNNAKLTPVSRAEAEIKTGRFRGNANPKAILHSIRAFEVRYDCPVVWQPCPGLAAALVESWAWWFSRGVLKAAEGFAAHASAPVGLVSEVGP